MRGERSSLPRSPGYRSPIELMKADLGIGDTAFGLLQGLSFALL
jgi:hypothetical protein